MISSFFTIVKHEKQFFIIVALLKPRFVQNIYYSIYQFAHTDKIKIPQDFYVDFFANLWYI